MVVETNGGRKKIGGKSTSRYCAEGAAGIENSCQLEGELRSREIIATTVGSDGFCYDVLLVCLGRVAQITKGLPNK